jgi:hypothetical protein
MFNIKGFYVWRGKVKVDFVALAEAPDTYIAALIMELNKCLQSKNS